MIDDISVSEACYEARIRVRVRVMLRVNRVQSSRFLGL